MLASSVTFAECAPKEAEALIRWFSEVDLLVVKFLNV